MMGYVRLRARRVTFELIDVYDNRGSSRSVSFWLGLMSVSSTGNGIQLATLAILRNLATR